MNMTMFVKPGLSPHLLDKPGICVLNLVYGLISKVLAVKPTITDINQVYRT